MFEPLSMLNGTSLDEAMLTDFVPAASAGGAILSIIVIAIVPMQFWTGRWAGICPSLCRKGGYYEGIRKSSTGRNV